MARDPAGRLRHALLLEAAALRRADFAALARIAEEKDRCLDETIRLAAQLPPAELLRLRALAATNARLIDAARQGIAAARDRVCAIIRARSTLETYAPDGSLRSLAPTDPRHERRA